MFKMDVLTFGTLLLQQSSCRENNSNMPKSTSMAICYMVVRTDPKYRKASL